MSDPPVHTVEVDEDARIVVARGELDFYVAPAFRSELLGAVASGRIVVVDLLGVTFVDSTALGTIIAAVRRLPDDARLAIACAEPDVRRVLELTGVDRLVPVYETVAQAFADGAAPSEG